ncbi:MAG: peptide chain release factor N(5)-glutamine methyltransferase [Candidatus Babeliaceae bacterium]
MHSKSTIFINELAKKLESIYPPHAAMLNAWFLLEKLTNQTQAQLMIAPEFSLADNQKKLLEQWLHELIEEHKPIQYIYGSVPFLDATILVKPPILIPRPETEEWCFNLIQEIKKLPYKPHKILDLCTGSGCIALALAQAFPFAHMYATDISQQVLDLAQQNAVLNKVTNITWYLSDLFDAVKDEKFDLIVSNPPYIDEIEWEKLDREVKEWEDKGALCAPDHGLALIKKIITQAPQFLNCASIKLPQLWIEIGYNQGPAVKALFENAGFNHVIINQDSYGKDRLVTGYCHE